MPKLRLAVTKGEEIRFISHLDYAAALERAIRRAKLPAAYSEGFNPHMKIAFASALAVGTTSDAEYMDLELTEEVEPALLDTRLRPQLPPGVSLVRSRYMEAHSKALMAVVNLATYEIRVPLAADASFAAAERALTDFNAAAEVIYEKQTPKGKREVNVKQFMARQVEIAPAGENVKILLAIHITSAGSVKATEVLSVLVARFGLPVQPDDGLIHRTGLFVADSGERLSPIDL